MKKIRDFFYNTNDIILVVIIVALAVGVIAWRMDTIMAYPQTLMSIDSSADDQDADADTDSDADTDAQDNEFSDPLLGDSIWVDGILATDITVKVSGGAAMDAVQALVNAGLFESYDEYAQICKDAGYTPENVHARTYEFSSGITKADIAKAVTE